METSPRYDDKKSLSKYANEAPHKARDSYNNPLKDRFVIGQNNLVCECGLMLSRYGDPSMLSDDEIHLRGATGKMAYTQYVASIMAGAGLATTTQANQVGKILPSNSMDRRGSGGRGGARTTLLQAGDSVLKSPGTAPPSNCSSHSKTGIPHSRETISGLSTKGPV